MRPALALLLLALLAYWPGLVSRNWNGTEGRRVQIASEMLATGDLVVPRLQDEPTLAKPPVYYWLLAAVQGAFGTDAFWMRLPSVLALWLVSLCAYAALRPHYGRRAGAIAGAGILCSPVVLYHGALAEIDPLFAVLTAISLLWLAEGAAHDRRGRLVLAGVVGGLALLTKGPPYAMFLCGSLLVWWRHRSLRPLPWFLVPAIALTATYYAVLYTRPLVAGAELADVAARESVGRLFTFEWHHVADIPLYWGRAVLAMLPLGLWTVTEYRGRHEARLEPPELVLRMCVGGAIAAVVLLTFFPGRPMRYLLPSVLLFCIAVAPAVAGFTWIRLPPRRGQIAVVRVLGLVGAFALVVVPWLPFPLPGSTPWLALVLALAPFVVRTRLALVGYALLVPVLCQWTAIVDRERLFDHGVRSPADVGAILRAEIERAGATDLATRGHFPNDVQLAAGVDPPGDEFGAREPSARWLLVEDADRIPDDIGITSGYRDRVRIRARHKSIVLREKVRE